MFTLDKLNDVYYVCSLIEYIGRQTNNHRSTVVKALGIEGIDHLLYAAPVNHCLSFEQVSDEQIERYSITPGDFPIVVPDSGVVPDFMAIGLEYALVVQELSNKSSLAIAELIFNVFASFLSDAISYFKSDLYYCNPSYLTACYLAGEVISED